MNDSGWMCLALLIYISWQSALQVVGMFKHSYALISNLSFNVHLWEDL